MDEILSRFSDVVLPIWERRWAGVAAAWLVALLGLMVIITVPDRYEATAKVYVDTQSVLKPLMVGLAVQPDIKEQVNMLARTMVSRPNIEKMMASLGGELEPREGKDHDRTVDALVKGIKVDIDGRENIYSIAFRDPNPERARRVVQGLVNIFVQSGLGDNAQDSAAAQHFIDDQIKQYEAKLREAEDRLKDFKVKNLGYTGQESTNYFSRVSQVQEELLQMRGQLHAAAQERDSLRAQLAGEEPAIVAEPGFAGAAPFRTDTEIRLDEQRKQLDDLLRRFTDEHPDVVAARRLIAQLEKQRAAEQAAQRNGDPNHGGVRVSQATNPVFQQIKFSLAKAEANVASLQARVSDLEQRSNELRAAAGKVPKVEQEYAELNRDYDVIRKNYEQLVARRESALISEDVSASSQLANFRIIEPTRVAPQPKFPSHMTYVMVFAVLSLVAGIAVAFGLAQLFPNIHNLRELHRFSGRPTLGQISRHALDEAQAVGTHLTMFVGSLGLLLLFQIAIFAWTATH